MIKGSASVQNLNFTQPNTDVMRDVLRLLVVDSLQNRNGLSTVLRRHSNLSSVPFDMVVCSSDMTSCPVELSKWQPSEAAFEACRPNLSSC